MKRHKVWATIGAVVLLLIVTALTGCVSKSEYEALQADYTTLLQENNSLETDVEKTQSDLASLQADYNTMKANYDELNANYGAVSAELAEIKEVYPPRYFKDYDELQDWLDKAIPKIETYKTQWKQHLDLQELALLDGYIWSVGLELRTYPISYVVAGNSIYQVSLPTGEIKWIEWR